MIHSGAQIRAARGLLGWSQAGLAKAAGLHVNAVRYYEAQHGRELQFVPQTGYGAEKIAIALHKAGVVTTMVQTREGPAWGICINPCLWNPNKKPPILQRWEKHLKPDVTPRQRARRAIFEGG
jgi:hypothetical protein